MKNCGFREKLTWVGIGGCLLLAAIRRSLARAQSSGPEDWERAAGGKMSFDVASVKRNDEPMSEWNHPTSNVRMDNGDAFVPAGGLVLVVDYTLPEYID